MFIKIGEEENMMDILWLDPPIIHWDPIKPVKFDIEPKCTIQSFFKAAPLGTKKIVVTNELPHELICDTEVDDRHRLSIAVNDNGVVIGYAIFSINDLVPNLQKILQENSDYLVEISHEGIKIYEKELD